MSPTRCGGGGGLLLLQRVRFQGAVVIHHLLHVPVVILDAGLPVVVVPFLLLFDLMLNL
jgi:hypothetical protein